MKTSIPMRQATMSALISCMALTTVVSRSAEAQGLDRALQSGTVLVGHRVDARPFSYTGPDGAPAGYTIELCKRIVEAIGKSVGSEVTPTYVPVTTEDRFQAVVDGRVDLLCGADTATLQRREIVSFTLPIFVTGIGAILSADAPGYLLDVLAGRIATAPARAAVQQAMRRKTFGVRSGTTAETWLRGYVAGFGATAEIVTVNDHAAGLAGVASGAFNAYFADRALLLGQLQETENPDRFVLSDRLFTFEPYAIGMPRGDEDLRLLADRTLSRFFGSPEFTAFFREYFGAPDERQRMLLAIATLPD